MTAAHSKPKKADTQTFLKHAPPTPGFPGNNHPSTRPTDPHDNDPKARQPTHGGSNKCLGCYWFFFVCFVTQKALL